MCETFFTWEPGCLFCWEAGKLCYRQSQGGGYAKGNELKGDEISLMISQCPGPLAQATPAAQQHGQIPQGASVSLGHLSVWGGETSPSICKLKKAPSFETSPDLLPGGVGCTYLSAAGTELVSVLPLCQTLAFFSFFRETLGGHTSVCLTGMTSWPVLQCGAFAYFPLIKRWSCVLGKCL